MSGEVCTLYVLDDDGGGDDDYDDDDYQVRIMCQRAANSPKATRMSEVGQGMPLCREAQALLPGQFLG